MRSHLDSADFARKPTPMKIAKEFHWEMGHRLPSHNGQCRNIHGHSYRMVVELEGEIHPDTGMLMDFSDISKKVKPLVAEFDHCFLCEEDDHQMRELLESMDMKRVYMSGPSTVENICALFIERLKSSFSEHSNLEAFSVRIWETASSVAEIREEL